MREQSGTVSSNLPGHFIRRLHQLSTQVFMQRVQEAGHNLTPVQFAALDALRHRPGVDQAGLADMIAKDRATAGAVVDRLRQKGLIERAVNRRDKRARELTLTSDGEAILAAVTPVVVQLQREILPGLDDSEYRQFIELAAKAVKATGLRGAS
ncbi:MarR family winged helix-turn-helix transcriptional regulator [Chelativorans salis]|uniref:MarR family transcriptional regulator n=1 Tax=Chelativorans salis TaxID=2978478 RepID=A0ABT2LHI1_9HYPH|nr:MarR family transcriptional regulator [Chelativorans sp. EGI FJ00035]MCT7373787.1 MarR family transcriptional regulator [Chelativorans sp. EGI FJ00035]